MSSYYQSNRRAKTRNKTKPTISQTVPAGQDTAGIDLNNALILNPTISDDPAPGNITTAPVPLDFEITTVIEDSSGNILQSTRDPIVRRKDWDHVTNVTSQRRYTIPLSSLNSPFKSMHFQKHKWNGNKGYAQSTCTFGDDLDSRNGNNMTVKREGSSRNTGDWGCTIGATLQLNNWLVNFSTSWLFNTGGTGGIRNAVGFGDSAMTAGFINFTYNPQKSKKEIEKAIGEQRFYNSLNGIHNLPYNQRHLNPSGHIGDWAKKKILDIFQ